MERINVRLVVTVNLDPVPGVFHSIESARQCVQNILNESISHYDPRVYIEPFYKDEAILISEGNLHILRIHDKLTMFSDYFGKRKYYLIISEDKSKHSLILPEHVFARCFEPVIDEYDDQFFDVREKV